jgi:hypothetical protein
VLKLGTNVGRSMSLATELQSRNEILQANVTRLSDPSRIERLAAGLGMRMPGPNEVHFVDAGGAATVGKALANMKPTDAASFISNLTSELQSAAATAAATAPAAGSASAAGSSTAAAGATGASSVNGASSAGASTSSANTGVAPGTGASVGTTGSGATVTGVGATSTGAAGSTAAAAYAGSTQSSSSGGAGIG